MSLPLGLSRLTASYGRTRVLEDLSLDVRAGELVSLLGASGCGKTTTLRLVAGFMTPESGSIGLGDRELTRLPAYRRDIGLVFQTYALFPHLSVAENVGYGLVERRIGGAERAARVAAMLERVGLSAFATRMPAELSGGQRQRVALARALVIEPQLLMFDEPLSNLDARLRVDMRSEIRRLQQANGTTALYVTHDQEEAFSISDRVAIMQAGRILQYDRPEVLYRRPANAFVAHFVGYDTHLPLEIVGREAGVTLCRSADGDLLHLPSDGFEIAQDRFVLAARADGLTVADAATEHGFAARILIRTYLGRAYQYQCETAGGARLTANGPLDRPLEPGRAVRLVPEAAQCCVLAAEA